MGYYDETEVGKLNIRGKNQRLQNERKELRYEIGYFLFRWGSAIYFILLSGLLALYYAESFFPLIMVFAVLLSVLFSLSLNEFKPSSNLYLSITLLIILMNIGVTVGVVGSTYLGEWLGEGNVLNFPSAINGGLLFVVMGWSYLTKKEWNIFESRGKKDESIVDSRNG